MKSRLVLSRQRLLDCWHTVVCCGERPVTMIGSSNDFENRAIHQETVPTHLCECESLLTQGHRSNANTDRRENRIGYRRC